MTRRKVLTMLVAAALIVGLTATWTMARPPGHGPQRDGPPAARPQPFKCSQCGQACPQAGGKPAMAMRRMHGGSDRPSGGMFRRPGGPQWSGKSGMPFMAKMMAMRRMQGMRHGHGGPQGMSRGRGGPSMMSRGRGGPSMMGRGRGGPSMMGRGRGGSGRPSGGMFRRPGCPQSGGKSGMPFMAKMMAMRRMQGMRSGHGWSHGRGPSMHHGRSGDHRYSRPSQRGHDGSSYRSRSRGRSSGSGCPQCPHCKIAKSRSHGRYGHGGSSDFRSRIAEWIRSRMQQRGSSHDRPSFGRSSHHRGEAKKPEAKSPRGKGDDDRREEFRKRMAEMMRKRSSERGKSDDGDRSDQRKRFEELMHRWREGGSEGRPSFGRPPFGGPHGRPDAAKKPEAKKAEARRPEAKRPESGSRRWGRSRGEQGRGEQGHGRSRGHDRPERERDEK